MEDLIYLIWDLANQKQTVFNWTTIYWAPTNI